MLVESQNTLTSAIRVAMVTQTAGPAPLDPKQEQICRDLESEARMLRRRETALLAEGKHEEAKAEAEKAMRREVRVEFLRSGAPIPPAFRTPSESLEAVDEMRHIVAEIVSAITSEELSAFQQALNEQPKDSLSYMGWSMLVGQLQLLCESLGMQKDGSFAAYRSPKDIPGVVLNENRAEVIPIRREP